MTPDPIGSEQERGADLEQLLDLAHHALARHEDDDVVVLVQCRATDEAEIEKLRGPLGPLKPQFFVLEPGGIRR